MPKPSLESLLGEIERLKVQRQLSHDESTEEVERTQEERDYANARLLEIYESPDEPAQARYESGRILGFPTATVIHGNITSVETLIRIANAEVEYTFKKRHWWSLGIPVNHEVHYDLKEQLRAIKDLGNTRSTQALSYLQTLIRSETYPLHSGMSPSSTGDEIIYPNAKGELARALYSSYCPYCSDQHNTQPHPTALSTIQIAIQKLEKELLAA